MAAPMQTREPTVQISIPIEINEQKQPHEQVENDRFDYSERSQWLRAAVLGANDGLVSVASLMMGVGAVKTDIKLMILTGFIGLIAGACSMAIGEFVSVYSQLDIEVVLLFLYAKFSLCIYRCTKKRSYTSK